MPVLKLRSCTGGFPTLGVAGLLALWFSVWGARTLAQNSVRLEARPAGTNALVVLRSTAVTGAVLNLEVSTNLLRWQPIGVFHDALFDYPDLRRREDARQFYRAQWRARVSTNDWKNQIIHPDDPFRSGETYDGLQWIKFLILLNDPSRVYYQDGSALPFHYDFAAQRLAPFKGMDRQTFDSISLFRTNQQVVLGAVLFPPFSNFVEYGVQFVGLQPFTPDEIARWLSVVQSTVYSSNGAGIFYVPTFEQSETPRTNKAAFDALGVQVASVERWVPGDHCYAPGWALGILKFIPATEIAAAFQDGRLRSEDILLTDGVPAETPPVAGIISLRPSTPNSHTAILSRSFGMPFVHFPGAEEQARLHSLVGRKVLLRANSSSYGPAEIVVFDVEGKLNPDLEAQLLALKKPKPIKYSPKQHRGAFSASTDSLTPADIQFFGGKAANYGFLRRQISSNSLPAIAFSFDLWDAFLDQVLPGTNRTLRAEIAAQLTPYTNFPPDIARLQATLANVRTLIRQTASFNDTQRQTITNALTSFDPARNIRFRSSTSVEDSENFTGAGLYDSYSGCLLDDRDNDTVGPSHCDPTESGERGVYRAIQRVYASFYNDNAFLERLRHGVDEQTVGMGVLVHHSFPDVDELANGVATLTADFSSTWTQFLGEMVTQKGAVSVTNPDGSSIPEVVDATANETWAYFTLTRYSSLVPLGAHVLEWTKEYEQFADYFWSIAGAYHDYYPGRSRFNLDFEYKKDRNRGLVVKQVREVPAETSGGSKLAFLLNEAGTLTVAQMEAGDVFANHRLKSIWNLSTHSMWLVNSNLSQGIYTSGSVEFLEDNTAATLSGDLSTWPDATRSSDGTLNGWSTGPSTNKRSWQLETVIETQTSSGEAPILVQNDFTRRVTVEYARPVPTILWGEETNTTNEMAVLAAPLKMTPGIILVERSASTNGVTVQTSFYWPDPPRGATAGYTAPLVSFVKTTITGLTSVPITLTNYYSQTYRPGHHNFTEEFVFEPGLEPGLAESVKAELKAANILLLYMRVGWMDGLHVLGHDQKFRPL